jgi:hypothetical protein
MKTMKILTLTFLAIVTIMVSSCKKDKTESDLTNQIAGNYQGSLNLGTSKSTNGTASADVTKINDYTVQVHCYGTELDTTFMLELYENGNSMMVCFTDDDFYNEYGHHESENHHMMGNNGSWTTWQQHMDTDHNPGDEHYGNFNMDNHSFEYTFRMHNNQGNYTLKYTGTKQ